MDKRRKNSNNCDNSDSENDKPKQYKPIDWEEFADRSSPAHRGEQPWYGTGHWPNVVGRALRELWPNGSQRREVVDNLHDYYQQFQDACSGD